MQPKQGSTADSPGTGARKEKHPQQLFESQIENVDRGWERECEDGDHPDRIIGAELQKDAGGGNSEEAQINEGFDQGAKGQPPQEEIVRL